MVKWYYRSIYDELEDLRECLELLDRHKDGRAARLFLPAAAMENRMMLPVRDTRFSFEVSEGEDELVVRSSLAPGTLRDEITVDLVSSLTLEISCEQSRERSETGQGTYREERYSSAVTRVIHLPKPVTAEESSAVFRHGVLEVRLKKIRHELKHRIPIG